MTDIDVYDKYEDYMKFQNLRPDYTKSIQKTIELAKKYTSKFKEINIADFCCGTGINTQIFANQVNKVSNVALIDINKGFLDLAKKSKIKSKTSNFYNQDILKVKLDKEYNLVFSIFAYHHVKDEEKQKYITQIKNCLNKKGILILTEIYLKDKIQAKEYYSKLISEIPKEKTISGLKDFLTQTAESNDFEFKVSKNFADNQFESNGFRLLEEVKIYPLDNSFDEDVGTFVQVYQLI
ncbi:MAG: class I SAM-dependent methyltransferase [Nanoarchaeota archaeon]